MKKVNAYIHYYLGQSCAQVDKNNNPITYGNLIGINKSTVTIIESFTLNRKSVSINRVRLILQPIECIDNYQIDLQQIFDGEFSSYAFIYGILMKGILVGSGWDFGKVVAAIDLLRSKGVDCDGLIKAKFALSTSALLHQSKPVSNA